MGGAAPEAVPAPCPIVGPPADSIIGIASSRSAALRPPSGERDVESARSLIVPRLPLSTAKVAQVLREELVHRRWPEPRKPRTGSTAGMAPVRRRTAL